ncbi:unnamed protein product [Adineta steineri]|uniref:Uncharacterized protein n=1 Tax=Adineta steineri TaxID=433720 RepID=A0A820HTC1_9BILA|nr:unnamed protein product [Adineta steineri]
MYGGQQYYNMGNLGAMGSYGNNLGFAGYGRSMYDGFAAQNYGGLGATTGFSNFTTPTTFGTGFGSPYGYNWY